ALRNLRNNEYPQLAATVRDLMPLWESDSQRMLMDSVFKKFDAVLKVQEAGIMKQLVSFDNYEDPVTKLLADDAVANQVIPQSNEIIEILSHIATMQYAVTAESDVALIRSVRSLGNVTWILAAVFIGWGVVSTYLLMRSITVPVNFLKNIVVKLGRGAPGEEKQKNVSNDDIGEMAVAMDNLVNGLKQTTMFAENIGKGNYKSEFRPLSEHDVLGNALLNMRDNLAKVAEEDKQRNWATEGMARFGEILRTNNNDLVKLADEIIRNLVKYLDANQGAIYIVDDVDAEVEPTMSMKACYAWDKKKFLEHQIHRGEGLAG